jgi:Na+/H+ antiporter NhaC
MDHVTTQLPYALLNAAISVVAFIAAGLTESYLVTAAAIGGAVAMYLLLARVWGTRIGAT